ncbi:hypothetical protein [Phocaeicola sp.]|uniref:hypothetical protein n=1 Tax=Phocaeicola sp. TaxID=2773926 RepID=UPI003AF7C89A
MERKVGEIFEYNGEWYQCMEGTGCYRCAFNYDGNTCIVDNPYCTCRSDKKNVIFKKLEKDGVPFSCNYYGDNRLIMMQEYKLYNLDDVANEDKIPMYITDYKHKRIAIEIKQNKENMEEKKLNLRPFDLEAAKAGKPVCTRDGRRARIICWDKKGNYPIVALIQDNENSEHIEYYTENGIFSNGGNEKNRDLMMLPQKKEGWVNVYNSLGVITFSHNPFDTKEEAMKDKGKYYVDTVKIEWEE